MLPEAGDVDLDDADQWAPDDPAYQPLSQADAEHAAERLLALWEKRVGKVQPADHLGSLHAFTRLHTHCKRSVAELRGWVEHVAENKDAAKWWGRPKSPRTWLRAEDGGDRRWQKIHKHWLDNGGGYTAPRIVGSKAKREPEPAPDPDCGCRLGWVRDAAQQWQWCPKCALGKWLAAGGRRN